MRKPLVTLAAVALALALGGAAAGGLRVGVNDDAAKDAAQVGWFYPTLGAEGLQLSTITLRWDDTAPATLPDQAAVATAIAAAASNGQTVELDLYPLHSQIFTGAQQCAPSSDPQGCGDGAQLAAFTAWVSEVAAAFPTVHEFVVMNECNQPLFVNPQFDTSGQNQSAEICGRALAGAYDALKAASPQNFVWGVGLSPRGNDNPNAGSNVSTSPTAFLRDLGAWFASFAAATGRTRPLMDGLDFHPYPIPQSLPFAQGYANPTSATVTNLPRIYGAFYDGFNGSRQPTIGQQAGGGLPVSLDEVGIQTDATGRAGYLGTETAANPAGGVLGAFATEAYQSSWYLQMLNLLACDPNVRSVDIYHLLDEPNLAGWQSGLYYLDHTPKQSAATVHDWIAATGGRCQGALQPWTPPGVAAAAASPQPPAKASPTRLVVAAAGRVRIFDAATLALRRVLAPFGAAYTGPIAIALGDVNRDGVPDFAVAEGAGGSPVVKILNGKTGTPLFTSTPFPLSFRGGLSVALGDVNGDHRADLIVGSGPGGGTVKVYDAATHRLLEALTPFGPAYRSGVSVGAGDLGGGGAADVIVGSGPGVRAQVAVLRGATGAPLETVAPFSASYRGGVSVASGALRGGGKTDLIVATTSGPTLVRAFAGPARGSLLSFAPFPPAFTGGEAIAAADLNATGRAELVVAAGAGGGAQVKVLDGATGALIASFLGAVGSPALAVAAG